MLDDGLFGRFVRFVVNYFFEHEFDELNECWTTGYSVDSLDSWLINFFEHEFDELHEFFNGGLFGRFVRFVVN